MKVHQISCLWTKPLRTLIERKPTLKNIWWPKHCILLGAYSFLGKFSNTFQTQTAFQVCLLSYPSMKDLVTCTTKCTQPLHCFKILDIHNYSLFYMRFISSTVFKSALQRQGSPLLWRKASLILFQVKKLLLWSQHIFLSSYAFLCITSFSYSFELWKTGPTVNSTELMRRGNFKGVS